MTEAEWLACDDPQRMLLFVRGTANSRKLRLFACACCRLAWALLGDQRSRKAITKLEAYADELTNERLRRDAYNIANAAFLGVPSVCREWYAACAVVCATDPYPDVPPPNLLGNLEEALEGQEAMRARADVLRDLVGFPAVRASLGAALRTPDVLVLASAAYDRRQFDLLPLLSDAVEEAGCSDADILSHLRSAGPHVRGCWALDLILGKS